MTLRTILANLVKGAFSLAFRQQARGASVLMYHSVGTNDAFFTVKPEAFVEQMAHLKASGRLVVPLSEILRRYEAGEPLANLVALTFDDGYLDNLETVAPILRRFGYRAALFLVPSLMGKTYTTSDGVTLPLFSADAFRAACAEDVFDVYSHTDTHPELPRLSVEAMRAEIVAGQSALAAQFGRQIPPVLAYPRGKANEVVYRVMSALGWQAAVSVHPGLLSPSSPRYGLPRNPIHSRTGLRAFRFFTSDAVYWFERLCRPS